ncbi:MAG: type IV pilin [Methanomicrobium sp.]|nr:type IV pilin [Methanomicrobium sp.]
MNIFGMKDSIQKSSEAVSPVVGVMLMLVVTVIIAGIASGFASGFVLGSSYPPTGTFNCKVINGGSWENSFFEIDVVTVSEPVPTKDVKLTVSWIASDGTSDSVTTLGPADTANGEEPNCQYGSYKYNVPLGYGPDIDYTPSEVYTTQQEYGNYALVAGRILYASPNGKSGEGYGISPGTRYEYSDATSDPMRAVLGPDWNHLRSGDRVNVRLTHIPTSTILYENDVIVEG